MVQNLHRRFATHKKVYPDLSYFDPKRFYETVFHGIPISTVNMICNLLPNKSSDSPVQQDLRQELLNFVGSVAEWLKHRTDDQHGLGSKPTYAILLCPWERHFTALSPAWWS